MNTKRIEILSCSQLSLQVSFLMIDDAVNWKITGQYQPNRTQRINPTHAILAITNVEDVYRAVYVEKVIIEKNNYSSNEGIGWYGVATSPPHTTQFSVVGLLEWLKYLKIFSEGLPITCTNLLNDLILN